MPAIFFLICAVEVVEDLSGGVDVKPNDFNDDDDEKDDDKETFRKFKVGGMIDV